MRIESWIRIGWLALAAVALGGCATGAGQGPNQSFMSQCEARAKTEMERSECAWRNAERMASGP